MMQCSRSSSQNANFREVMGRERVHRKFRSKESRNDSDSSNIDKHIDNFDFTNGCTLTESGHDMAFDADDKEQQYVLSGSEIVAVTRTWKVTSTG